MKKKFLWLQFLTRTLRSLIPDVKKLQEEFLKEKGLLNPVDLGNGSSIIRLILILLINLSLGNVFDCLRLKGFPLGVDVRDILNFLGVNCNRVANHGVHLFYTPTV
jgi:hypothetical protein